MNYRNTTYMFEGVDCVGKSTVIKELQKRLLDHGLHHFEKPLGSTDDERYMFQYGQFDMMFKSIRMVAKTGTGFIFDRAHIGEYIWGPMWRGKFPVYMPILEYDNKDLPIVLVHVTCDVDEIISRYDTRPDEKAPDRCTIIERMKLFEMYCERSPFPVININTTGSTDPSKLIDTLIGTVTML